MQSRGCTYRPSAVAGAQFHHGVSILGRHYGLQQGDPLKVVFVRIGRSVDRHRRDDPSSTFRSAPSTSNFRKSRRVSPASATKLSRVCAETLSVRSKGTWWANLPKVL